MNKNWLRVKVEKTRIIGWLKITIAVFGLVLTVFGFYIDHAEETEWVINAFAQDYVQALKTYERMLEDGSEIGPNDVGFSEIASILSEKLSGSGDLTIAGIRAKKEALIAVKDDGYFGPTVTIEITLQDGRSTKAQSVKDLRPELRGHLLEDTLFLWGQRFFWLGVGLGITAFLLEQFT